MDKEFLENPLYKYTKEFSNICQPILNNTCIKYFSISRYYYDGYYTAFQNNHAWGEYYLPRHFNDTMLKVNHYHAYNVKNDFALWTLSSAFSQDKSTDSLYQGLVDFNFTNGITLIQRCEGYSELYWFASSKKEGIDHFFIERLDLLKMFIYYVLDKIHINKELNAAYKHRYRMPLPSEGKIIESTAEDHTLYEAIKHNKYYIPQIQNGYLTRREYDVLCLIRRGNTAKQIAYSLDKSHRTIEHYIDSLKSKLDCVSRLDLIQKINKINLL